MVAPTATAPTTAELTTAATALGVGVDTLHNGNELLNGAITEEAADILTARSADMVKRHVMTLESVEDLELYTLKNMGCAHGLDMLHNLAHLLQYTRMICALDALPAQTDPVRSWVE